MDTPTLRLMIHDKLADGRLPHNHIPRVGGGLGNGETCDGCGEQGGQRTVNASEASIVRRIFKRRAQGAGYFQIAGYR